MYIDWENKPDWAEVWVETTNPRDQVLCGGWHKSDGGKWVDENGFNYLKRNEGGIFRVHYPPAEQPQDTVSALIDIIRQKDEFIKELITELTKRKW